MPDVTFIGLGNMGAALARTVAKAGLDTVVWNRSEAKAKALQGPNLTVAPSPEAAILASPVIIVCVYDYDASDAILKQDACAAALGGRVLVQLTTATPRGAKAAHDWAHARNIAYLDGELVAYPSDIGGDDMRILASGDERALEAATPVLNTLTPEIDYLGTDPAKAAALSLAINSASLGRIIGTINAAAICEAADIPLERFLKNMDQDTRQETDFLTESLQKIASGGLETADATVEVWGGVPGCMSDFARDTGYSAEVSDFMRDLFTKAIRQGLGAQDVGALIDVLRPAPRSRPPS